MGYGGFDIERLYSEMYDPRGVEVCIELKQICVRVIMYSA
jgi:hypothetical protein